MLVEHGMMGREYNQVLSNTVAAFALALVPLFQFGAGLVYYAGDFWIFSGALLGFGLAVASGSMLQRKGTSVTDAVATGALCASIVSVGIQLWQWLGLSGTSEFSGLGLWLMNLPSGARPFANLAQPNQLSTLLLWGLASVWWIFVRRRISSQRVLRPY